MGLFRKILRPRRLHGKHFLALIVNGVLEIDGHVLQLAVLIQAHREEELIGRGLLLVCILTQQAPSDGRHHKVLWTIRGLAVLAIAAVRAATAVVTNEMDQQRIRVAWVNQPSKVDNHRVANDI